MEIVTFLTRKWLVAIPTLVVIALVVVAAASGLDKSSSDISETSKPDDGSGDGYTSSQSKDEASADGEEIETPAENEENQGLAEVPSLITPYVDIADMASINEAYSESENAPWGFRHQGVDFFPIGSLAPFRAVCSGTIGEFRLWQASENSNWQVNVSIEYNETYTVGYAFEPFSTDPAVGQAQLDNMRIAAGQHVEQGDIIGYLVFGGGGTHVDFNLSKNRDRVSPENYFTPEALASVLEILHRTFPGASLSYP